MTSPTTERQPFRPVGKATPAVEATAGAAAAGLLGAASAIRRKRIFHPAGVAFRGEVSLRGASLGIALLDQPATHPAVVRLSRGVGLPERFPDFLGVAIRIIDAHGPGRHQDLLMVTAGEAPGARHALIPRRGFRGRHFSTLLPYRLDGHTNMFGAATAPGPDLDLDGLRTAGAPADLDLDLLVAPATGGWRSIGTVTLGSHLPAAEADALRFDPSNTGGGIRPAGTIQAIRRLAYRASQFARPDTP